MPDKISWPIVAVVGIAFACVTVLGVAGADTTIIIQLIIALGLGGGLGVLSGIRNNVNGNLSQLVTLLGDSLEKLSKAAPIPDTTTEQHTHDVNGNVSQKDV